MQRARCANLNPIADRERVDARVRSRLWSSYFRCTEILVIALVRAIDRN